MTELIPLEVLFGNPQRIAPSISHDGTQLGWIAPHDGVLNVWVAPVGKLDQAKPVTSDTTRPIRQYFWVQAVAREYLLVVLKVERVGQVTEDLADELS